MKPQINFRSIATLVTIFLLTGPGSHSGLQAQSASSVTVAESKADLQVKFIGTAGEFIYFEISMQQADESRSNLRIRNENGNELYAETIFRKSSIRKLKIAKDEAEKLEFVYNTGSGDVKKVLEIKIKYLETVEVKDIVRL